MVLEYIGMSLTGFLTDSIIYIIDSVGYLGVFILMTLESALIPIPSEVIMPFSGFLVYMGRMNLFFVITVGAFGNLIGSFIAYFVGLRFGRGFLEKYGRYLLINDEHIRAVEEFFKNYGSIAVFIGRLLPAVRTIISFPAGMSKMNLAIFSFYTLFGSYLWNFLLVYIGIILKERWEIIQTFFHIIDLILILTVLCLIIYLYLKYRKANQYK